MVVSPRLRRRSSMSRLVNANAHVHALVTEGAFAADGTFKPLPLGTDLGLLSELFRQYVFRALRKARRISDTTIQRMLSWTHSGFNCYVTRLLCGVIDRSVCNSRLQPANVAPIGSRESPGAKSGVEHGWWYSLRRS